MPTPDLPVESHTYPTEVDTFKPYPSSWIDHFTAWITRLPFPPWLCYLGLWFALSLLYSAVKWWDGAYPPGTVNLLHLLLTGTSVYGIALMHYLDRSAERAFAAFRPVLTVDARGYADLHYRLTTLPAWPSLWVSLLAGLWRGPYFLYHRDLFAALKLGTSSLALALEIILFFLIWAVVGAFVYHTLHQLRLVSRIYRTYTHINLFQLGPLYALSHLTARTALGIIFPTVVWMIAARLIRFPLLLGETALFLSLVALLAFLWPLRSAHAVLTAEKQRLQDKTAQQLAGTFVELDRRIDAGDLDDMSALKTALDGLRAKQEVIDKLSTWPWQIDTLRGVVTAAVLPLVIWLIQRLLDLFMFAE